MELLNGFEEAFMIDDNFDFTEEGDICAYKYGVSDSSSRKTTAFRPATHDDAFPVFQDPMDDLEWLIDKDPFPTMDSCFEVLSEVMPNHQSPIYVLDTVKTNGDGVLINHPKGTRSNKRRRRRRVDYGDLPSQRCLWSNHSRIEQEPILVGRRCQHCLVDKTPQWRAGPMGPKTLCNACGVRYKSGRLHPEYRPACSPTFSSHLHSNSHKKVMEMRMKKQDD